MSIKDFNKQTVTNLTIEAATRPVAPTISGYAISGTDDTALDPAGGQTILVNGSGFRPGATITLNSQIVSVVSFVSVDQLSFTSPALSAGTYNLFVVNTDNGAGVLTPGLVYSTFPTWSTSSGSQGSYYETTSINNSFVASSDSAISSYTLYSGTLPTGSSLASNGVLTGTAPVDSGSTTYTFTLKATDSEAQDSTRSFSLTINADVVSWSTPSNGAEYTLVGNQAMSDVTLSATSAAGYAVSYAANALPTGVTLSSGTISGTPTVAETTSTLLTATAATTGRIATRTISWTVNLGDTNWKNTIVLLSGDTPTTTFINDASLNNSQLAIVGDTKPNNFNPYTEGYYSNYFDGSGDYFTLPSNQAQFSMGTGDFTIEMWINVPNMAAARTFYDTLNQGDSVGTGRFAMQMTTGGTVQLFTGAGSIFTSGGAVVAGAWHHIAYVRISNSGKLYVNGKQVNTTYTDNNNYVVGTSTRPIIGVNAYDNGSSPMLGYISNLRVVKGTGVYTSAFTPSTTPLTAISGTSLLTCQSNRLVDNSFRNFTLTKVGDTSLSMVHPFTTPTTASYNNQYSTYFDGTSGHLSVPTNSALSMDSSNFSAECWCYLTTYQSSGTPVMIDKSGKGYVSYSHWSINSKNGYWGFDIGISGTPGTQILAVTTSTLTITNQWHHVALVKTGTTYSLFLNGTRIHTATSATVPVDNNPLPMAIGFSTDQTSLSYWFGYIADVRVNKGTLPSGYNATQTTITVPTARLTAVTGTTFLSCQDSTLKDNSTNNLTINSINPAKPVAVSPFTMTTSNTTVTSLGSAYFDGTGDYLTNTTLPAQGSGDFTIECWVYNRGTADGSTIFSVGDKSTTPYTNVAMFVNTTNLRLYIPTTTAVTWDITLATYLPTNAWTHHAVTRSGSTIRWFVNGVQVNSTASGSGALAIPGTYIGYSQAISPTAFTGQISDFRVINGSALYTSNFLPPQTPLTPVTNTQLLTCQYNGGANNNGFVDQSRFNNALTRVGNTTQGTFSPFSQTGWSNYIGTTAMGWQTPASSHLTTTGYSYFQSGMNLTIEAWINPLSRHSGGGASFGYVAGDMNLAGGTLYWSFGPDSDGKLCLGWYTGSIVTCKSTNVIPLNTWTHIAVSISSGTIKLFINGVSETLVGTTSTSNVSGNGSLGYIASGGYLYGGTTWQGFNGYISDLRISKAALYSTNFTPNTTPLAPSASTGLLVAQTNRFIDNSVNNYTLTLTGTPSIQASSPFGSVTSVPTSYSYNYDGTGDGTTIPSNAAFSVGTGDFTVEAWINPRTWGGGFVTIFAVSATNGLYFGGMGGSIGLRAAGVVNLITTTAPTLNTWTHVAASREGTSLRLFVNGALSNTVTDSTNFAQGLAYIGGDSNGSFPFNGAISNVRLVKGTALYTSAFTPSTSPLTTTSQGATASQVSLLTAQSDTFKDNSLNNFILTAYNEAKPTSFNPFGNTTTTMTPYSPGANGGSIYMDGDGDYLSAVNTKSFDLSVGPWTIECWFYQLAGKTVQLFSVGASAWRLAIASNLGGEFTFNGSSTMLFAAGTFPSNQWNHIAVSFNADGSGTAVKTFANGKQIGAGQFWPSASSSIFYVGRNTDAGSGWDFNGYITGIRITHGECLYYNSFVPSFTPAQVTKNTAFLANGTSGGIIDYHSTNNVETVGDTRLAPEGPYAGTGYYSAYFDGGSGSYLTVPAGAAFNLGSGDFSIEMWVLPIAQSAYGCLLTFDAADYPLAIYYGSSTGGGMITAAAGTTSAWFTNVTTMTFGTTTKGVWTHILMTRSGDSWRCFQDGVLRYHASQAGSVGDSSGNIYIGSNGSTPYATNANISNLRIIKGSIPTSYQTSSTTTGTTIFTPSTTPLTTTSQGATSAQVSLLTCQNHKFQDNSTNNFTVTRNGVSLTKSINPFQQNTGKSLYFDGTGDYLKFPETPGTWFLGTSDFTMESWVYISVTNASEAYIIARSQHGVGSDFFFGFSSTNQLRLYMSTGGSNIVTSTGTVKVGEWTHVAATRSGTSFKLFINGVVDGTLTSSVSLGTSYGPTVISNASNNTGSHYLNGYIKDLRITKGVARYTTTFTPPATPFDYK